MLSHCPPRVCFLLGFLFCVGLLLAALYFQFAEGLDPCPLCISQRVMVAAVGFVMLAAVLHNPGADGVRFYAILGGLMALIGGSISARHVYIQHLPPDQVPACGPGLGYMFEYMPIGETLRAMLTGTGDCAKVTWNFLGLSMPAWVLICFLALAVLSFLQIGNRAKGGHRR